MSLNLSQYRDLSSLFMRGEVNRWFKGDFTSIDAKLHRHDLIGKSTNQSYLQVLKIIYKKMVKDYQNEYVIKNEFLNQCLKLELRNSDTLVFNELRLGPAIADLAMFNGVSKAFEIKTILDNECRLDGQITAYKKIFNEVYVVVPHQHVEKYSKIDDEVGIIVYDVNSNSFRKERQAAYHLNLEIDALMNVLHTNEYKFIVNKHYGELPSNINSFNQFDISKNLIKEIPKDELNRLFLEVMKQRKIHNLFFNKNHSELNQICLSLNLKKSQRDDLIIKLRTKTV